MTEPVTGKRLPSSVYWFGATSFSNDLASEMVYPLLPAFVTRTLGGGALALGVLDGVAEAVAAVFKVGSGYAAERPSRRGPLVVAGYAIAGLVRPLLAVAAAAWQVIALRAADRLGKGIRTAPRDVMIADAVPGEQRGRAFGLHRAADHAGAMLGPLVAATLLALGLSVREVFWAAAVPGILAVVLAMAAVRRAGRQIGRSANGATATPDPLIRSAAALPAPLLAIVLGTSARMPETLLILRAQDLGISVAAVPLLWAALHVVRAGASVPGGVLADRFGPRRVIMLGWTLYATISLAFAVAESATAAWLLFLSFGLVAALTESPERKLAAGLQPYGRRGRGFGWYHGLTGLAALPAATLFGFLYQRAGAGTSFITSAVITIAALAALIIVGSGSNHAEIVDR